MLWGQPGMNAIAQTEKDTPEEAETKGVSLALTFPRGLMGFEQVKNFKLLRFPEEDPFLWLQMAEGPELSFLLLPATQCIKDYHPDFYVEDLDLLELVAPDDLGLFNIVTVKPGQAPTANMKGPIALNLKKNLGGQFVLRNGGDYGVRYPLPVEQNQLAVG